MYKRILAVGLFVLGGMGLFSFTTSAPADDSTKNELIMKLIVESLNANHYDPNEVNDDFSNRIYDLYLKRLDYNKRFFVKEDIEQFEEFKNELDNQVLASEYDFFDMSMDIFELRLANTLSYYKEILVQPFDFTIDETIEVDNDDLVWAESEAELKDRWRKLLKYQVLSRMVTKLEVQENDEPAKDGEEKEAPKTLAELEQDAREKVMKTYKDWEGRLQKTDKEDRRAIYLNAIASTYDPHTSYYPPKDKENFDIQMSGRLEGIGASLVEKDGYIQVARIVPGSPSYRQGELAEDDMILKVAQGSEDPVDIVDMRLDDAVQLIRGKKGTEVRLTVKKVEGSIKVIPIVRDVVILQEVYAKSAVIKNEAMPEGIGYIKLPKFYADFSRKGGRNSGSDVRDEVSKLKEQGIKGLVLDLRNNGGGSLMDVVEMAGLFIEEGPIVQIKGRYGMPQVLEDRDPMVHYDGPLVILVNSSSASASEIMAAAIQDYKRGIVVGTPTFGKGTVQRFYKLDNLLRRGGEDLKPLGDIKLTTQKFYRINGGATQLKGVTPDVILPDAYFYIERGEKLQDHAMPWDEISSTDYSAWSLNSDTYSRVRKNSRTRIKGNDVFGRVQENAQRLKTQRDVSQRSLNLETYRANEKRFKEEAKKFEDIFTPIEGIEIANLPADLERIGTDTVMQKLNDDWFKKLEKDAYINEAISILNDIQG